MKKCEPDRAMAGEGVERREDVERVEMTELETTEE